MIPFIDVLSQVARDLAALGHRFALVGGLATSLRAEPRTTRDVDLAVAVKDDVDAEKLVRNLVVRRYRVLVVLEHERTGRLATVRLLSPLDGITVVDLLLASCGIEPEIVAEASAVVLAGISLPVARAGHLVAMKLLADDDKRPQDRIDLVALRAVLSEAEIEAARTSCKLIEQRGTNRGRDLMAALEHWLGGANP